MKARIIILLLIVLLVSCNSNETDKTNQKMEKEIPGSNLEKEDLLETLSNYIASNVLDFNSIPEERKDKLNDIGEHISGKALENKPVNMIFICTHNSRRSHMSQLWAQVAAFHYDISQINCFSGGTAATAFNPRAVAALNKAGFQIDTEAIGSNPVYMVKFAERVKPVEAFSKKFSDSDNPQDEFIAIMTCSDADEACPIVPGAEARFSIPYEDPKVADNTQEEVARYDERCRQIAIEMFYLFSNIKK